MNRIVLAIALSSGCAAVPPPPVMTVAGLPIPDDEGATTVLVALATTDLRSQPGLDLRVHRQVRDDLKVGVSLAGGVNFDDDWIRGIVAGRFYGAYYPGAKPWVAVPFGVGVGLVSTGMIYATADTGALVNFDQEVSAHFAPLLGVSVPLRKGRPMLVSKFTMGQHELVKPFDPMRDPRFEYPRTTFWFGASIGVQASYGDGWKTALEGLMLLPSRGLQGVAGLSLAQAHTSQE